MAHSLSEALSMFAAEEEVFIIGGSQIYAQALPLADRIYLTTVGKEYDGDSSFPAIDPKIWHETSREEYSHGENFEHPFSFVTLERVE